MKKTSLSKIGGVDSRYAALYRFAPIQAGGERLAGKYPA
jgi:hypothetical protein